MMPWRYLKIMSEYFTYLKMPKDISPASIDDILDVYPWSENENREKYSYVSHYAFPVERLSAEFKDILAHGNMVVQHIDLFYRPGVGEEFDAFIHTDGHQIVRGLAKINFIIGGENNIMSWYMPSVQVTEDHVKTTNVGTKYLNFKPDEVNLIDEAELNGLYVVNAGIPHGVKMTQGGIDKPRICISLVPRDAKTLANLGCNDTYVRLLTGFYKTGHVTREYYESERNRILGK